MMPQNTGRSSWLLRQMVEAVAMVAVAIVIAGVLRATVAQAYEIPSESMEPTIMTDDRVIAEKLTLRFRAPEIGDVVVIDNPYGEATPFIKRVIALPGQTVDLEGGDVVVDGEPLAEPYTHGLASEPEGVPMPLTVPAGYVWVMGDNRTDSRDSRFFGSVPITTIRARAVLVYWPLQHLGTLDGTD